MAREDTRTILTCRSIVLDIVTNLEDKYIPSYTLQRVSRDGKLSSCVVIYNT